MSGVRGVRTDKKRARRPSESKTARAAERMRDRIEGVRAPRYASSGKKGNAHGKGHGKGRPERYLKRYKQVLRSILRLNALATKDQIAEYFGVHVTTIHDWCRRHPAFAHVLKYGAQMADQQIADALHHRARGFVTDEDKVFYNSTLDKVVKVRVQKKYAPDTPAALAWLASRQRELWRKDLMDMEEGPEARAQRIREELKMMDEATAPTIPVKKRKKT